MASNKGDLEGNDISAMIVEQPGNLRDTPPHPPSLLDLLPIPSRSQPLRDLPTEGPRKGKSSFGGSYVGNYHPIIAEG